MANSIEWGQGSINNDIDCGKGASNSIDNWGLIQSQSWSGETNIVGSGGNVPSNPFLTDLVGSYSFDSAFTDYTGQNSISNNSATWFGTPYITLDGKVNPSLRLINTLSDRLYVFTNDYSFTDGVNDLPFSISFWTKTISYSAQENGHIYLVKQAIYSAGSIEYKISYEETTNNLIVNLYGSNNVNIRKTCTTNHIQNLDEWYHYSFTYDGSKNASGIKVYINGILQTSTYSGVGTYTGMVGGNQAFNIGGEYVSGYKNELDGNIDELHIWKNRQLSDAEILEIYNTENEGLSLFAPKITSGFLAENPFAKSAYSLRNLSNLTTRVIRVRRSNDNTEQDFTSTEITDGTLATFCAGTNGYVTVWYDQTLNLQNLTQPTANNQPIIVENGVVYIDYDGKPFIYHNHQRVERYLTNGYYRWYGNSNSIIYAVFNGENTYDFIRLIYGNSQSRIALMHTTAQAATTYTSTIPRYFANSVELNNVNSAVLHSNLVTGLNVLAEVTQLNFGTNTTYNVISPFNGNLRTKVKELIIYPSNQIANQTSVRNNINTEYSIY